MNRIVTMVLKNFPIVPGAWQKLCRYAKHPEKYSEEEMYRHIQYILKRAVRGGNIDLQVSGTENIPKEGGFMLYANHQGMFDVLAVAASCTTFPFSIRWPSAPSPFPWTGRTCASP